MSQSKRQEYQKQYYQKNKERILAKARQKSGRKEKPGSNVVSLWANESAAGGARAEPPPPPVKAQQKRLPVRDWTTWLLYALVAATSYFLVTETAHFFSTHDGNFASGVLKALILEGAAAGFCLLKGRGISGLFYKLMAILIYSYGVWTLSGSVLQTAFTQNSQIDTYGKIVAELETEIAKKTAIRDSYFAENRISLGMKLDRGLEALKHKLQQSREILLNTPQPKMVWNVLLTLVTFRILAVVSNFVFLGEVGRRYRLKARTA